MTLKQCLHVGCVYYGTTRLHVWLSHACHSCRFSRSSPDIRSGATGFQQHTDMGAPVDNDQTMWLKSVCTQWWPNYPLWTTRHAVAASSVM